MRLSVLLGAILVLFASTCLASVTGKETDKNVSKTTLSGKVVEFANAEGITGATITIVNTGETVYTDFDGNFTVNLPEGEYDLEVKMISYQNLNLRKVKVVVGKNSETMVLKLHEL